MSEQKLLCQVQKTFPSVYCWKSIMRVAVPLIRALLNYLQCRPTLSVGFIFFAVEIISGAFSDFFFISSSIVSYCNITIYKIEHPSYSEFSVLFFYYPLARLTFTSINIPSSKVLQPVSSFGFLQDFSASCPISSCQPPSFGSQAPQIFYSFIQTS